MRLTIIHPAIGHRPGEKYIRSWQMEPLPAATVAGLTPADIELRFYDDRLESIPYDEPADAVVMSVETYTAKRAYQIASEYRKRNIQIIFGGFHATLAPDEVQRYAEAVVIGEAELLWKEVIDDLRHNTLKKRYQSDIKPDLARIKVDRTIFKGKRYLPIGLVESGRGCRFLCDFCAIQTFFDRTHRARPVDDIVQEIQTLKHKTKLFFFVDDNFAGDINAAKPLLRELAKLDIRWITQMSINAAHDEEFLFLLNKSGCKGVLIGFESLNEANLKSMEKSFNMMKGGYENAMKNLWRHSIRVYATFVFGYEHDTVQSFRESVEFAIEQRFYIAAFNHLTPFPGTPLYKRLEENRMLRFESWWLDEAYRYNDVPFYTKRLQPEEIARLCVESRKRFYSLRSIVKRGFAGINRSDGFMFRNYFPINFMHRNEINKRNGHPLGDETWQGQLLEASR
ncbi:MAG: B12-binding domain-containing radical SAM protein [Gammaproteobacteria bacterium]|nr:B12-binding domain-containing radical SAM protein [Gammaproteobacteria bacterium]